MLEYHSLYLLRLVNILRFFLISNSSKQNGIVLLLHFSFSVSRLPSLIYTFHSRLLLFWWFWGLLSRLSYHKVPSNKLFFIQRPSWIESLNPIWHLLNAPCLVVPRGTWCTTSFATFNSVVVIYCLLELLSVNFLGILEFKWDIDLMLHHLHIVFMSQQMLLSLMIHPSFASLIISGSTTDFTLFQALPIHIYI